MVYSDVSSTEYGGYTAQHGLIANGLQSENKATQIEGSENGPTVLRI